MLDAVDGKPGDFILFCAGPAFHCAPYAGRAAAGSGGYAGICDSREITVS